MKPIAGQLHNDGIARIDTQLTAKLGRNDKLPTVTIFTACDVMTTPLME